MENSKSNKNKKLNKSNLVFSLFVAICFIAIGFIRICFFPVFQDCGDFSLQTYAEELQTEGFMSDNKYDEISSYREAAKCAAELLKEELNSGALNEYCARVYFDDESDSWLVHYTLKSIYVYHKLSADYYVVFSADGDVIARWGVR